MTLCEPAPGVVIDSEVQPLGLPDGVPPLCSFYLYLTSACNLRCRHCWVAPSFNPGGLSSGEYLDIDLLRRAVSEAKPLGLNSAKLTGGEPVLHPQFIEIVDLLTDEGLALNMETNGTLIDAPLAQHLKQRTNLSFVSVSLDGPNPEVHDAFRGVAGSFERALRGFRHLAEAGYHPQLIMALHRGNVAHIEETVEMATELGAGSVKFNPVIPIGRGLAMHKNNQTLGVEEVLQLARFVRGDLQSKMPIPLILDTPLALYTVRELIQGGTRGACNIRHILGILGSGEMALCGIGYTTPVLCLGNLREASVPETWLNHPLLQQLRQDLDGALPGICGRCIHARRCLTHCIARNYHEMGRLVSPSMLCVATQERGLFPSNRLR